jgi:hypothetical protein
MKADDITGKLHISLPLVILEIFLQSLIVLELIHELSQKVGNLGARPLCIPKLGEKVTLRQIWCERLVLINIWPAGHMRPTGTQAAASLGLV